MLRLVSVLRCGLVGLVFFRLGICDEHEYRLTKYLLDGYDAGVRPAKNSSQPLVVAFGLALHHIIDVDEKNQILTTNCWLTQMWTDHHLKWNVSEFAGIHVIRVPYNRVWRPDTILYNNADPQYSSAVINTNVIVSYTGEVVWLSHGIFRSSCDIDVEYFPFDEQRCVLKWASWTYDGYQLTEPFKFDPYVYYASIDEDTWDWIGPPTPQNPVKCKLAGYGITEEGENEQEDSRFMHSYTANLLDKDDCSATQEWEFCAGYKDHDRGGPCKLELERQSEQGDVSNYQANGEFDLVDFSATRNVQFYSCCPEPYPDITYEIRLRRRPMFYVFNLILPCILINGIALLVFYVPSESGEKVTLGISALLSMTVFLMTIRETLPPTEKTPLISLYYGVSICLVSFASGLAVVTLNLHHRGVRGTRVPQSIKSLVLNKLAKIVFLNFQEDHPESVRRRNYSLHCKTEASSHQIPSSQQQQQQIPTQHMSPKYVGRRHASDNSSPTLDIGKDGVIESQWARIIGRVQTTIERNERRLLDQDNRERTELEWKQVALVSDRALLCVFFLTTAVSTAVILCGSPPSDGKTAMST